SNDLGVSLGLENAAISCQPFLKRQIIFDNAIVNDNNFAGLITMRMCIFFGRTSVRCPACMADAVCSVQRIKPDGVLEIAQFALSTPQRKLMLFINYGNARRIVSAIFQFA